MEELKQQIIDLCNESGLPLEAILFVTKDVWRDVDATLRAAKNGELFKPKEENKQEEEE